MFSGTVIFRHSGQQDYFWVGVKFILPFKVLRMVFSCRLDFDELKKFSKEAVVWFICVISRDGLLFRDCVAIMFCCFSFIITQTYLRPTSAMTTWRYQSTGWTVWADKFPTRVPQWTRNYHSFLSYHINYPAQTVHMTLSKS